MNALKLTALPVVILLLSCASYSTGRYGGNLNDEALSHLAIDMSMSEVRSILGTPTSVTNLREGRELWSYMYKVEESETGRRYAPIPPDGQGPPDGSVTVMFFSTGGLAFVKRQ
jgi:outer membrane protein assembly factor BamE (lipoprotein component of BamABCDE complex)